MFNDIILSKLKKYTDNCRNESNDIPLMSDEKKKQLIKNLIKEFSIDYDDDYIQFSTRTNEKFYKENLKSDNIAPNEFFDNKFLNPEIKGNYVSSLISNDEVMKWNSTNSIFIMAGTGKGKNHFIQNSIINKKGNTIIFLNRSSLYKQQIVSIIKNYQNNSDHNANLIYKDFISNGIIKIGNVMLITYQSITTPKSLTIINKVHKNFFNEARYVVFDEIHYIIDDAEFNKGTNLILNILINENLPFSKVFPNATKIFMSATMEETLLLLYLKGYIFNDLSWRLCYSKEEIEVYDKLETSPINKIYYIPTDYSYITPYSYTDYKDIIEKINKSNEKWLIFVNQKSIGNKLKETLKTSKNVRFIHSDNTNTKENEITLQSIYNDEKMDCDVLIATSVLYNGINLKNNDLRNIVLPLTTLSMAKQFIGRRRVENNDRINVFFYMATEDEINEIVYNKINEYFKIKQVLNSTSWQRVSGINKTLSFPIEYLNAIVKYKELKLILNETAAYKVHFDTMFYLYMLIEFHLYKKSDSNDTSSVYVNSLLAQLGIMNCKPYVQNITPLTQEQIKQQTKNAIIELIKHSPEKIYQGSSEYMKFKEEINILHKKYTNKNIDIHWNSKTRDIPVKKINAFLCELGVSYVYIFCKDIDNNKKENKKKYFRFRKKNE